MLSHGLHADNNTFPLQNTCIGITRKLRALITVEDLWSTMSPNSLLKAVNAKRRVLTVADPSALYTTRVPVDDWTRVFQFCYLSFALSGKFVLTLLSG